MNSHAYSIVSIRCRRRINRRSGVSLLEILLSLVVLGVCLAAVVPLESRGVHVGMRTRFESEAHLRCQAILQELQARKQFQPQSTTAFDDDPRWKWHVDAVPHHSSELIELRVTVERVATSAAPSVRQTLTQLVRRTTELQSRGSVGSEP